MVARFPFGNPKWAVVLAVTGQSLIREHMHGRAKMRPAAHNTAGPRERADRSGDSRCKAVFVSTGLFQPADYAGKAERGCPISGYKTTHENGLAASTSHLATGFDQCAFADRTEKVP